MANPRVNILSEGHGIYTEVSEILARNYPEAAYNGGFHADDDPADYVGFSVKAVRLG